MSKSTLLTSSHNNLKWCSLSEFKQVGKFIISKFHVSLIHSLPVLFQRQIKGLPRNYKYSYLSRILQVHYSPCLFANFIKWIELILVWLFYYNWFLHYCNYIITILLPFFCKWENTPAQNLFWLPPTPIPSTFLEFLILQGTSYSCGKEAKAAVVTPGPPRHTGLPRLDQGTNTVFLSYFWVWLKARAPNWLWRPYLASLTQGFQQKAFGPHPGAKGRVCLQILRKERCVGLTPHCHFLNKGACHFTEERSLLHFPKEPVFTDYAPGNGRGVGNSQT